MSLVLLLSISAGVGLTVSAETSGEFEYTVLDDGTAEITKYIGSNTTVKIPDVVEKYKVTSIKFTYELFPDVQELYIPYTIEQIKNLNQNNYHGFENCYDLKEIVVDENNNNFTSKDGVLFNKNMTELLAFPKNKEISSYTVPDSVTTIQDTFSHCKHITEIKIPASTTDISLGYYAFDTLFHNCEKLNSIYVDPNNSAYSSHNGVLFNKDKTELIRYPMDRDITHYEIPDTVTHIGWYSFLNCNKIQAIFIPESVRDIGWYSFGICEKLTDVYYTGSEEQWNKISIYTENYALYNAVIHYNWQKESEKSPILSDGTDTEYVIGSSNGASVHCSFELADFVSADIDGVTVDSANYTLSDGSTIITFAPAYLDTLSAGDHIVTLNYTDKTATSVLTVKALADEPTTDDNNPAADPTTGNHADGTSETTGTGNTAVDKNTSNPDLPNTGAQSAVHTGIIVVLFAVVVCAAAILVIKKKKVNE